ncbi:MAG TPA: hypothetical protein VGO00_06760, partial [Kofleriaceae bacterium]|nr:hypothetical protein [Kofleriaceae bacterium]
LRNATPFRDSGELTAAASPRPNRATDEQTVARAPLSVDDLPTYPPNPPAHEPQSGEDLTTFPPVNQRFDADEDTRLVAPRDRRTPVPERNTHRPPPSAMPVLTAPPPTPPPLVRSRGPTPGPPMSRDPASANARAQNPLPGLPPPINGPTLLGPPPIPLGPPPSTSTEHTPPPGTVHGRSQSEPSVRPQPILPAPVPAPAPVMAPPPSRPLSPQPPPPSAPSLPPMLASSYPAWEPPKRPPSPILEDRASHKSISPPKSKPRPASRASMQHIKSSKQAIKPWMLVVGAVVMAGLAFAVTRACIHPTARAAAEIKPATP